mmetsp:Transcript_56076/g.167828  ORF Transcript_56076/g.167828 Transcript_56076/m.167828 type:complete len:270 (-) Transcript_56076:339-1148(-)
MQCSGKAQVINEHAFKSSRSIYARSSLSLLSPIALCRAAGKHGPESHIMACISQQKVASPGDSRRGTLLPYNTPNPEPKVPRIAGNTQSSRPIENELEVVQRGLGIRKRTSPSSPIGSVAQYLPRHHLFPPLQLCDLLLDAILHNELSHSHHVSRLPNAMYAIHALILDGRIPPRIDDEGRGGRDEVDTHSAGLHGDEEDGAPLDGDGAGVGGGALSLSRSALVPLGAPLPAGGNGGVEPFQGLHPFLQCHLPVQSKGLHPPPLEWFPQ